MNLSVQAETVKYRFGMLKRAACAFAAICALGAALQAEAAKPTAISDIKVPKFFTIHQSGQAMLMPDGGIAQVPQVFLDAGAVRAESYQLIYKQNEVYKYGVIYETTLPGQLIGQKKTLVETVKEINAGILLGMEGYRVVTPIVKRKDGTYAGTIASDTFYRGDAYRSVYHVVLYEHRYYGPSIRVLMFAAEDDALLRPMAEPLMNVVK